MLYIWYDDRVADYNQGCNDWTGEWVATDPSAGPQSEGISGLSSFRNLGNPNFKSYQGDVTVLISETAPVNTPGFNIIDAGTLWWSPISGKLYIYYTDPDSNQWVEVGGNGDGGGGGEGGFATIASLSIVNRYVSLDCPFGDVVINRITLSPWFNVKYFIFTRLAASNRRRALRVVVMDVVDCRN